MSRHATQCRSLARIGEVARPAIDRTRPVRLSFIRDRTGARRIVIRDELYHITVEMLDGIEGGNQGVMVVGNDTPRGAHRARR